MKTRTIIITCATIPAFAIGILAGRYLFPESANQAAPVASVAAQEETTTWTCSMHPQIQQPQPGDCPICGMDLIPLEDTSRQDNPREMSMSESARALAEIQTSPVERRFPEAEIRLVGKLEYDETLVKSLTARFPARIEQLYVNYTGIRVNTGEHLALIYSPELLTAQSELLTAYRSSPEGSITQAARQKLRLWDLLPQQIGEIIEAGEARDRFELKAPISGVVTALNVREGDYIETGEPLFKIVDLSRLWLMLDAYESDLSWLRYGQTVEFSVEAYPGETFNGTISFIQPEINRSSRTVKIRVNVDNGDGRLKPGMFARGLVKSRLAMGGRVYAPDLAGKWISPMHPEIVKDGPGQCDICGMDLVPVEELGYVEGASADVPLVVPSSAVLRTGKRAVVYVQKPGADTPTYEGREITLGPRAGNAYIVNEGLDEGELVVTNGAFKIDSALQIQARPSMMNPAADGPGMDDIDKGMLDEVSIGGELSGELVPAYLKLQAALADDDIGAAKEALREMMSITGHAGDLPDLIHTMLAADSLDAMRRPHFETLSNALIASLGNNPSAYAGELFLMHCPMVYEDRGADWLQGSDDLRNPYYGGMMLFCGEVKGTLNNNTSHEGHEH